MRGSEGSSDGIRSKATVLREGGGGEGGLLVGILINVIGFFSPGHPRSFNSNVTVSFI